MFEVVEKDRDGKERMVYMNHSHAAAKKWMKGYIAKLKDVMPAEDVPHVYIRKS